jgi:hypothetical protein
MTKAHPKTVWHLSRGDEQHALISERELRLLAELGKLQPNDLLWKPGFDGWRTVHSVPGILTPPPLPRTNSPNERSNQIGAKASRLLSLAAELKSNSADLIETSAARGMRLYEIGTLVGDRVSGNVNRWRRELWLIAKDWLRSSQLYVRLYGRGAAQYVKKAELGLETCLSRVEHPRVLAGLLGAVVLVGVLDIAKHKSLADAQPAPQNSGSTVAQQPEPEATTNSVSPLESTGRAVIEGATIDRTLLEGDHAFSIVDIQLSDGFGAVARPAVEPPSNSHPAPSKEAAASNAVPLPTKKPAKPIEGLNAAEDVRAKSPAARRVSQAPTQKGARQPKPMPFGVIGFNYSDPAL